MLATGQVFRRDASVGPPDVFMGLLAGVIVGAASLVAQIAVCCVQLVRRLSGRPPGD